MGLLRGDPEELSMGHSYNAKCTCGLEREFLVGTGFAGGNYWLGFCSVCKDLVRTDEGACLKCGSKEIRDYRLDAYLQKTPEQDPHSSGSWDGDLTEQEFLCPSCGKFTMTFEHGGLMWD